jgi:hypothetical protein
MIIVAACITVTANKYPNISSNIYSPYSKNPQAYIISVPIVYTPKNIKKSPIIFPFTFFV